MLKENEGNRSPSATVDVHLFVSRTTCYKDLSVSPTESTRRSFAQTLGAASKSRLTCTIRAEMHRELCLSCCFSSPAECQVYLVSCVSRPRVWLVIPPCKMAPNTVHKRGLVFLGASRLGWASRREHQGERSFLRA